MSETYINRLRGFRARAGKTQAELGAMLAHPTKQQHVALIERGRVLPLTETAWEFAAALSELIGEPVTVRQIFPGLKKRWKERGCIRGGRR